MNVYRRSKPELDERDDKRQQQLRSLRRNKVGGNLLESVGENKRDQRCDSKMFGSLDLWQDGVGILMTKA